MAQGTVSMQRECQVEKFLSESKTRDKVRLVLFDGYYKRYIAMASATQSFINTLLKCFGIQRYLPVINKRLEYCWKLF